MKPLMGLMLLAGAGVAVWAIADAQSLQAASRKAKKKISDTTGVRLPQFDTAIVGPTTAEEFQALDESISEQMAAVCAERAAQLRGLRAVNELDSLASEVAKRALAEHYPDFPWPAITGDHSSALEIQGLILYRIRAGSVDAWCAEPLPIDEGEAIDELEDDLGMDDGYLVYQPNDQPPEEPFA